MTNCLFVTLERYVLLIKNAIEPITSPTNAYGRSVVKIGTKTNISQDKDALPFYTGFQFPIILMYAINIDSVTTRLYTCNITPYNIGQCISMLLLRPWTTKSTLSWTASRTTTGSWAYCHVTGAGRRLGTPIRDCAIGNLTTVSNEIRAFT